MRRLINVILGGAVRQIVGSLFSTAALILVARALTTAEMSAANETIYQAYILSAILGMPYYSGLYHGLTETDKPSGDWVALLAFSIVATAVVASALSYFGFLLGILGKPFYLTFLCASLVAGATVTAVPLARGEYKIFNIIELVASFVQILLAVLLPLNLYTYFLMIAMSQWTKVFVFLCARRGELVLKSSWSMNRVPSYLRNGTKLGFSGAVQTAGFRMIPLLLGMSPSSAVNQQVLSLWPIFEKFLILAQAANAVIYGVIRRAEANTRRLRQVICVLLAGLLVLSVSISIVSQSIFIRDSAHKFEAALPLVPLILIFMFLHSGKIMILNAINALGDVMHTLRHGIVFLTFTCIAAAIPSLSGIGIFAKLCIISFVTVIQVGVGYRRLWSK